MNIQSVTNNTAVGAVVSRPPPVEGQPVPKESQAVKGSADRTAPSTGQDGQVSRQQLDQAVKAVGKTLPVGICSSIRTGLAPTAVAMVLPTDASVFSKVTSPVRLVAVTLPAP